MNQILYTGKNNNSKMDVNSTLKVFTVLLIIFAICFIGLGIYIYNGTKVENKPNTPDENISQKPDDKEESKIDVTFSSVTDGVKIKIKSNIEVEKATYKWDNESEKDIELGENLKTIVAQIGIKQGIHTLYVTVRDIEGNEVTKEQSVIGDKGPDVRITTDGRSNYVIQTSDDEKLSKIVIILNNEIVLEKELDEKEFTYNVPIPQGDSVIQVKSYNLNDLVTTKKANITGFSGR